MRKPPFKKETPLSFRAKKALGLWDPILIPEKNLRTRRFLTRKCFVKKNGENIGLIAKIDEPHITRWLYYPKIEHFENFDKAASNVQFAGPGTYFRGSVGSIYVGKIYIGKNTGDWVIKHIQSHFKTTIPGHMDTGVNRALATKYGGWRQKLLSEIFREAKTEKKKVLLGIGRESAIKRKKQRRKTQQDILEEIAEKEGFTMKKEGNFLVASCE